jgi:hypothetical protein
VASPVDSDRPGAGGWRTSCRGASPSTKEWIETGWTGRGSPWQPSDGEVDSGVDVVDDGTDTWSPAVKLLT